MGLGQGPDQSADVPRRPTPTRPPRKALDDAAAAKLLRAAHNDKRLLVRVTVEVLLRTGLRVGEFTSLPADAVVQIGAAPSLHVPVGKLREDRYLPLHPHLVTLIDDYRSNHVSPVHPLLLPRENGTALDRHAVTRILNNVATAAGLGHIHPHQLRHTLATQAINRGMSLEAIAAMLGHRSMDMTLRYAKIANRTVANEYFAVTDKVDALYQQARPLPADTIGPKMARLRREHHRLLGNGYCTRPAELDCAFESICETCSFFQTSIEFRPTLQAQHDDAHTEGQHHRADLFSRLLTGLNEGEASGPTATKITGVMPMTARLSTRAIARSASGRCPRLAAVPRTHLWVHRGQRCRPAVSAPWGGGTAPRAETWSRHGALPKGTREAARQESYFQLDGGSALEVQANHGFGRSR